jgi:hypothetical protein
MVTSAPQCPQLAGMPSWAPSCLESERSRRSASVASHRGSGAACWSPPFPSESPGTVANWDKAAVASDEGGVFEDRAASANRRGGGYTPRLRASLPRRQLMGDQMLSIPESVTWAVLAPFCSFLASFVEATGLEPAPRTGQPERRVVAWPACRRWTATEALSCRRLGRERRPASESDRPVRAR